MFGQILGDFNAKSYKELTFNQNLHIEYYLLFYCISDDHSKISAESDHFGCSRRSFALMINDLVQHEFFCIVFGIIHFLHPQERVCGFEFFSDAARFY